MVFLLGYEICILKSAVNMKNNLLVLDKLKKCWTLQHKLSHLMSQCHIIFTAFLLLSSIQKKNPVESIPLTKVEYANPKLVL